MLAQSDPREAYRKVDLDARVAGAGPQELVSLCYEQFVAALGSALFAAERGDNRLKSQALTRALSVLAALELGVNRGDPISTSLIRLYEAARLALVDSAVKFDSSTIGRIRQDFADIGAAFGAVRV
jgi:flagellar protein FliS